MSVRSLALSVFGFLAALKGANGRPLAPDRKRRRGPAIPRRWTTSRVVLAALFVQSVGAIAVSRCEAAPLRLAPATRTQLTNGLVVVIQSAPRLPLVDLRLVVAAGSMADPAGKEGLANLVADLLTQGAGSRNAREFAEAMAFLGGRLEASASREQLTVSCEVLSKDFPAALELFRDCVVAPKFEAEEFQRKQAEALGTIEAQKDDPSTVADLELLPFLIGSHPLAHPTIGWSRSVSSLRLEDAVSFHRRHVVPANAILCVVGDVDSAKVLPSLEQAFGDWQPANKRPRLTYGKLPEIHRQVLVVDKPEVTQSQIRFGAAGVSRNHPDYYAITVANTILGGGFTSRLVNEIRVVQGLTYGIRSRFGSYRGAGTFTVSTFTKNETLRQCVDATLLVIRKLVEEGPTEGELDKAKRYLTGQFPLGLQSPDELAEQLADIEFHGLERDYLNTYCDRIDAVTMADVRRVLRERFPVDGLRILVVSQAKSAVESLDGLGTIQQKDIE